MNEELLAKVRRMYAALGETIEDDLSKFTPTVLRTEEWTVIVQDFSGGLAPEQISNIAHSSIYNIATLADHLRKWARKNGHDVARIDAAIAGSLQLQVIIDLSNADKHGYPSRDRGKSGRFPKLAEVKRVMRLSSGRRANSGASVQLTPPFTPVIVGSGRADGVITGTIVDGSGALIGDLHQFMNEAMVSWEALLHEFGLDLKGFV